MIYFIESQGLVKIGFSLKPELRVSKVQSDSPYACKLVGVMDGTRAEELEIQAKFEHLRVRGEWFTLSPELRRFIEKNPFIREPKAKEEPGDVIGRYLWRNGINDRHLAEALGVSKAQICRIRNGKSFPSRQLMKALYEKTGITPNEMFGVGPVFPEERRELAA